MQEAGGEFNPDSPKQLGDVLFNRLGLRSVMKTKTGHSTDIQVLEKLATEHKVPKLIIEYRSLVKLKNTYLDNLTDYLNPRTGRIHASFNQTGAETGRLELRPSLQNIPIRTDEGRRIRLAFVPGDPVRNVLLTADYSQISLRPLHGGACPHPRVRGGRGRAPDRGVGGVRRAAGGGDPPAAAATRRRSTSASIYGVSVRPRPADRGPQRSVGGELIKAYHKRSRRSTRSSRSA